MHAYLCKVSDNEVEGVLLHVGGLAPVRRLQDLQHVLHGHIPLQVGLAVHLQPRNKYPFFSDVVRRFVRVYELSENIFGSKRT